ncbi:TKL/DRK protein kinase [Saprolegnia diclina VS20]|uniref:TKL/DRK protein kinase n=1 Tax=Saprolegnia diclina (strain VS20) TaxID=1156394 RepID=T0Q954_SAPDV|nr:TKL/DRK protein kinase [Saprolegnia diclina VS20]EQC29980.1 TKL/DRK protein kinase [Saprolegnia diclina VS20]|eukprot:XP_008616547.1 TKL/DRK protein kinase [Saprolegnia diclina VS20]
MGACHSTEEAVTLTTTSARHGPPPARVELSQRGPSNPQDDAVVAPVSTGPKRQDLPLPKPTTPATAQNVPFSDFKEGERDVVESILESKIHLRMAAINFKELKLQKVIGKGAFGEVIKGTYHGTPVVVKRMVRQNIDPENVRMFAEEIQLMMNLRHPNIVQFIGASWNSYSNICFVTEFLDRGDLYSVLKNPRIQLSWHHPLWGMTIDISRGMAYLHSMDPPIIHRDLKSMNILVSSSFGAKISDFGLSREKAMDDTMSVTGTPLWLPPEMIRAERYSEKADVYSFGIVLSELDTRRIPYHDVKSGTKKRMPGSALLHKVAYEHLRPSLSPHCLDSVRDLFVRCTADNPKDRPTFEAIVAELETSVQREILQRHNDSLIEADENDARIARDLGVKHVTNYVDDA